MVTQREFEGKDLEDALAAASRAMGIAEPELHYRIVEQGRRGLFGLGAKSVRIRVMPPVVQPAVPRVDGLKLGAERAVEAPARAEEPAGEPAPPPGTDQLESTVRRMLELMGLDLEVQALAADNGVQLRLDGPDRKLLSHKDGELMSALQFLLNRMARRAWPEVGRIRLASDGRRRGRDNELVELTREVAQQVDRTGKTKRLHPMNAYERRLVHVTVREYTSLGSRSEGNGPLKRVRIYRQA